MNLKTLLRSCVLSLFVLFSGCGDKPKEQEKKQNSVINSSSPKIEIVQNENAQEIKVKEKQKKKLEVKDGKAYYYDYNVKSEYDQNAQPANKDASVRTKPRTAIDAALHVRSPYEKVKISMLVKKLSKKFIVKCSACHNDYANGIIGPSLLKKTSDEILKNIADFKSGRKSNPLMNDLIKMMSDDEIKSIAMEIYEFNQKIKELRK
jgi:cytochrome c553